MEEELCVNSAMQEIFDIIEDRFPKLYAKCRFWNIYIKDQKRWGINFSKDDWIQLMPEEHQTLRQRLSNLGVNEKFTRLMVVGLPMQTLVYTAEAVHLGSLALHSLQGTKPRLFKPPPLNYGLEVALNVSTFCAVANVDHCREIFLRLADQFLTGREASTMSLIKHDHPSRVDCLSAKQQLDFLCNTLCTTVSMFGTGVEKICLELGTLTKWETLLGSGCSLAEFKRQAKQLNAEQSTLQGQTINQWLRYIEGPKPKRKAKSTRKQKPAEIAQTKVEQEPEVDRELEQTLSNMKQSWENKQRAPLQKHIFQAIQSLCIN